MSEQDPLDDCECEITQVEYKPGKFVHIRALDSKGRAKYWELVKAGRAMEMHAIAALGICKSATDATPVYVTEAQIDVLAKRDGKVLQKIAIRLLEVSGLAETSVEDAEKKSGASPS